MNKLKRFLSSLKIFLVMSYYGFYFTELTTKEKERGFWGFWRLNNQKTNQHAIVDIDFAFNCSTRVEFYSAHGKARWDSNPIKYSTYSKMYERDRADVIRFGLENLIDNPLEKTAHGKGRYDRGAWERIIKSTEEK